MPEYVADEAYHVVRLRDGRQLSYAQYGDPDGFDPRATAPGPPATKDECTRRCSGASSSEMSTKSFTRRISRHIRRIS